jgi:hypothetical protein
MRDPFSYTCHRNDFHSLAFTKTSEFEKIDNFRSQFRQGYIDTENLLLFTYSGGSGVQRTYGLRGIACAKMHREK